MGLVSELRRRNVLRMAVLYVVAAWLVMQVAEVFIGLANLPEWIGPTTLALLAVGFPIALIFSWFYELTAEGISLEKNVEAAESITHVTGRRIDFLVISLLCAAVILLAYDKWWMDGPPEYSIAVLPFENMSDDPGQEFLSDGISEEILNVLAKIPDLHVTSRSSAFSFKGKDVDIPTVAKQLGVANVLEGSVRKSGGRIRIAAQLIEANTDKHLWSETYDRELEDIFAIQDEISGHIVQALKVALGTGGQGAIVHAQQPTENLEAYEQYLRGRYFWQRRGEDNIRHAIDLFEQATALDPQFARAWSSLAAAYITLPNYSDALEDEQWSLAESAAKQALALDDSLAEAYAVLGGGAIMNREWAEGEAHSLSAIASEPKNSTAHLWYGENLVSVGRVRDALEETHIAYQLDPLHPGTNSVLAGIYLILDDTSNALKYGAAAWDLGHVAVLRHLAWSNLRLGEVDRAIELAEQYDEQIAEIFKSQSTILRLLFEAKTDTAKRPIFLKKLAQNESVLSLGFSVLSYAGLGQIDDAYRLVNLRLGRDSRDPDGAWMFLWQPDMAAFRQDPRFIELVTELGLLDYWRENGWPDACQPASDSLICE